MSWIILALVAMFFWALSNIVDKILRTRHIDSSLTLTASFGISGIFYTFIMFLFAGLPKFSFDLLFPFFAGICIVLCVICYIKALSLEETSRVVPLWNLSPLFVLIIAVIFLKEILNTLDYLAFALILAGGFLVSVRKTGKLFKLSPALIYMIISSSFVAFSDTLLKYVYDENNFWQIYLVFSFSIAIFNLSLFFMGKTRKVFSKTKNKKKLLVLLFVSNGLGLLGYLIYSRALLTGPVTLVSVFVGFQSLFALILATLLSIKFPMFIKEAIDKKTLSLKFFSILLMILGLFLLSF